MATFHEDDLDIDCGTPEVSPPIIEPGSNAVNYNTQLVNQHPTVDPGTSNPRAAEQPSLFANLTIDEVLMSRGDPNNPVMTADSEWKHPRYPEMTRRDYWAFVAANAPSRLPKSDMTAKELYEYHEKWGGELPLMCEASKEGIKNAVYYCASLVADMFYDDGALGEVCLGFAEIVAVALIRYALLHYSGGSTKLRDRLRVSKDGIFDIPCQGWDDDEHLGLKHKHRNGSGEDSHFESILFHHFTGENMLRAASEAQRFRVNPQRYSLSHEIFAQLVHPTGNDHPEAVKDTYKANVEFASFAQFWFGGIGKGQVFWAFARQVHRRIHELNQFIYNNAGVTDLDWRVSPYGNIQPISNHYIWDDDGFPVRLTRYGMRRLPLWRRRNYACLDVQEILDRKRAAEEARQEDRRALRMAKRKFEADGTPSREEPSQTPPTASAPTSPPFPTATPAPTPLPVPTPPPVPTVQFLDVQSLLMQPSLRQAGFQIVPTTDGWSINVPYFTKLPPFADSEDDMTEPVPQLSRDTLVTNEIQLQRVEDAIHANEQSYHHCGANCHKAMMDLFADLTKYIGTLDNEREKGKMLFQQTQPLWAERKKIKEAMAQGGV
jgi:hypothetical protein